MSDEQSTVMRMVRATRDATYTPAWYELVIGVGLMAAGVYSGHHIVQHPEHEHLYAWAFVGGLVLIGLALVAPLRARMIWSEIKVAVPWLHSHDDHGQED